MNEMSGALAPVVRKYLNGDDLDADELRIMRAYLRQWVAAFVGPAAHRLRDDAERIDTNEKLRVWLGHALDLGIDPL
jgi:hypothetical protein